MLDFFNENKKAIIILICVASAFFALDAMAGSGEDIRKLYEQSIRGSLESAMSGFSGIAGFRKVLLGCCLMVAIFNIFNDHADKASFITEWVSLLFRLTIALSILGLFPYQRVMPSVFKGTNLDNDVYNFVVDQFEVYKNSIDSSSGPEQFRIEANRSATINMGMISAMFKCNPSTSSVQCYINEIKESPGTPPTPKPTSTPEPNNKGGYFSMPGLAKVVDFLADLISNPLKYIITGLMSGLLFLIEVIRILVNYLMSILGGVMTVVTMFFCKMIVPFMVMNKEYYNRVLRAYKIPLSTAMYGFISAIIVALSTAVLKTINIATVKVLIASLEASKSNSIGAAAISQMVFANFCTVLVVLGIQIAGMAKIPSLASHLVNISLESFVDFGSEIVNSAVGLIKMSGSLVATAGAAGAGAFIGGASAASAAYELSRESGGSMAGAVGGAFSAGTSGAVSGALRGASNGIGSFIGDKNKPGSGLSGVGSYDRWNTEGGGNSSGDSPSGTNKSIGGGGGKNDGPGGGSSIGLKTGGGDHKQDHEKNDEIKSGRDKVAKVLDMAGSVVKLSGNTVMSAMSGDATGVISSGASAAAKMADWGSKQIENHQEKRRMELKKQKEERENGLRLFSSEMSNSGRIDLGDGGFDGLISRAESGKPSEEDEVNLRKISIGGAKAYFGKDYESMIKDPDKLKEFNALSVAAQKFNKDSINRIEEKITSGTASEAEMESLYRLSGDNSLGYSKDDLMDDDLSRDFKEQRSRIEKLKSSDEYKNFDKIRSARQHAAISEMASFSKNKDGSYEAQIDYTKSSEFLEMRRRGLIDGNLSNIKVTGEFGGANSSKIFNSIEDRVSEDSLSIQKRFINSLSYKRSNLEKKSRTGDNWAKVDEVKMGQKIDREGARLIEMENANEIRSIDRQISEIDNQISLKREDGLGEDDGLIVDLNQKKSELINAIEKIKSRTSPKK